MKKNILFIGAPGSGKGTQSSYLIDDYGLVQISTGDILRAAVKNGTELGKLAKHYMDEGKLVPDEVIVGVMKDRLQEPDTKNGVIFDGFPRTIPQAVELDAMLKELGMELTHVISLEVPDEMIYERITGRRSCPACGKVYHIKFNPPKNGCDCDDDNTELVQRADDTEETLSKRLKIYHESTSVLKPYYEKGGKLLVVDGRDKPELVYSEIKAFLDK